MRVNVYAEEMTDRIEIVAKEIDGQKFTGLRIYLELPMTLPEGWYVQRDPEAGSVAQAGRDLDRMRGDGERAIRGPYQHRPGDDDSAAVTFWGCAARRGRR
jgi:hypothetical protein